MMKTVFAKAAMLMIAVGLLFAGTAMAAEQGDQNTSRKEKIYTTKEIKVTAQKQEEDVQEVPMSITVFSGMDIEDIKIESMWEMIDYVPNLMNFDTGMSSGFSQPTMRGISAPSMTYTTSVGLYVDGVPMLSSWGFEEGFIDIERIEVLRGPQGTLYGKNTETGAINVITRQPDNDFRGKVSVQGGEDGKAQASLNISGPIQKDKLFLGIAGQYYQKDGFVENTLTGNNVDDKERWFGRVHLRWKPVDDLDMSLIVSRLTHDEGETGSMNLAADGAAMFGLPLPPDRKVSTNMDPYNKSDNDSQSLKIAYNINEALTLTSVTARKVLSLDAATDFDFSSSTYMHASQDSEQSKLSQELRLDFSSDKWKWLVGFYYDKDNRKVKMDVDSIIPSMVSTTDREFDGNAYAVFGQVNYAFTPRLNMIAGLRYEQQEMEFEDYILGNEASESWDQLSPKIALEYKVTPTIMAYASASKGYRSGGFNVVATDPQYKSYDAETLWSYEIGMKNTFLNNRLMLNWSLFYMDIDDMQVEEAISPFISYTTNAAKATALGGELELAARVTTGLTLMAGFGYCDVEFDEFKDALGDYQGNKNPYAPEYTFNIGAQYRHQSGLFARADLIGYGKTYFDKANEYSRDAYEIVNAKIGYETEHFDVYLYAKNLLDKEYDAVGYYSGAYVVYSDPREVGLQVTYRF